MSQRCVQRLARLQTIVAERQAFASQCAQITRMHNWVLDVERILDGSWAKPGEMVSNDTVGRRLDAWREQMAQHLTDGTLTELEQKCLTEYIAAEKRFGMRGASLIVLYRIGRTNIPQTLFGGDHVRTPVHHSDPDG